MALTAPSNWRNAAAERWSCCRRQGDQTKTVPGWRAKKHEVAWSFDIVGDHATIKFHIALSTPMSLALVCTGETCDLGWVGTRAHVAVAATLQGARVAVVHGGISADGAGRDAWRQLFAELAATLEHAQVGPDAAAARARSWPRPRSRRPRTRCRTATRTSPSRDRRSPPRPRPRRPRRSRSKPACTTGCDGRASASRGSRPGWPRGS